MRSSDCATLFRFCARLVLCWPTFPLVPALRSTGSAALTPADTSAVGSFALFVGLIATMAWSDFSCPWAEPVRRSRRKVALSVVVSGTAY
jgi:hypothetical protein